MNCQAKPRIKEKPLPSAKDGRSAPAARIANLLNIPVEWLKNTLTFHPNRQLNTTPDKLGLPYEEVRFGGSDGRTLHGWYIPSRGLHDSADDPLFIWFHGNAGHIGHRLAQLCLLHEQVGGSHFLFDYQGFGLSRGRPTIAGILQDAQDALAYIHSRGWSSGRRLVYMGESLGCAVAIPLALEHAPAAVILSAPFYSLRAMGHIRVPPLAFLVENDLNNARLIGQFRSPLLVIHGTEDRTVPFQQGFDLYSLAPEPKIFYKVEGGGHTNLHETGGETYLRIVRDFVMTDVVRLR
jgi:fermentation-respiration switch protein FrsA (DUF1100 family)